MIDSLVTSPTIRMLEQTLNFTEQRHEVLLENVANVSTPGYVEKDLSAESFQKSLRAAVEAKRASVNGTFAPESTREVEFEPHGSGLVTRPEEAVTSVAFHDRGIRNMERLMSKIADNAMAHNMVASLLRTKYDGMAKAISMRV